MSKSVDHVNHIDALPADADGDEVFEAIHAVMHLYRSPRHRAAATAQAELTHMEHKVLGYFSRHPGATQSDLAAHAGRDKGQLARLIAGLRARGLLEARTDEADRRNLRLQPSAAAAQVQQAAERQARVVAATAVAGLSQAERSQLLALLRRVRGNLEAGA
ncbi:MAG: helix-turn-helix domain-containing protein [Pseudomonadota bacterium]